MDRFDQFVAESESIIPAIADVVDGESIEQIGELARRSQSLGAEKLGNQIRKPFTWPTPPSGGAAAASAQGAGFGGSVWALVSEPQVEAFMQGWGSDYRQAFPESVAHADFFATRPGPPATSLGDNSFF